MEKEVANMKKFTIIYDAVQGHAVADGKVEGFVDQCIASMKKDGLVKLTIGSALVLAYISKKIMNNELDINDVELFYRVNDTDTSVTITKDGHIMDIPDVYSNCFDAITDHFK